MDRSACHDSQQHASDGDGCNDAHRLFGTDHAPLIATGRGGLDYRAWRHNGDVLTHWFPPWGSRTISQARHRFGCIWSLLIKNLIVRCGENLLTGLRVPGELWISPRQPPLRERVEDS